jgi:NADH dehydrogenase
MATIGHRRAVAEIAGLRLGGTVAWIAWLSVHLMFVVGFANRILVLVRWMSSWLVHGRGERVLSSESVSRTPRQSSVG